MVSVDLFCAIVSLKYPNLKGRSYFTANLKISVNTLSHIYWRTFDPSYTVTMETPYFQRSVDVIFFLVVYWYINSRMCMIAVILSKGNAVVAPRDFAYALIKLGRRSV